MEYPKPVMKMGELVKMGFPRSFLDEAYRERGQGFAQKGAKQNSPSFLRLSCLRNGEYRNLKMRTWQCKGDKKMKMGAFMMGWGLLVCGLDLMPFWFMGTCVAAGLALIAQERDGWK